MKPALHDPLWWAACLVSVAAGLWIGSLGSTTIDVVVGDIPERPLRESPAPVESRNDVRRALERYDTGSLFESLLAPGGCREEVMKAVIDREGWKAWPKVLEIEDPELRERISASFLAIYAQLDPEQAFVEWKKHRSEFPSEGWGSHAMMIITGAAAQRSAESLVEVLEGSKTDGDEAGISTVFADDFDFARVMDYLAASESSTQVSVLNLLPAWAERSPVQAAKWIEAHRDFAANSENLNLTSALRQVAAADLHLSEREQVLGALRTLPEESVDRMWADAIQSSAGSLQASLLESATMTNRREDYLAAVLLEARRQGTLDDSWKMILPDERAMIVEAADASWDPGTSPVELKSKERWRRMIAEAWGTAP